MTLALRIVDHPPTEQQFAGICKRFPNQAASGQVWISRVDERVGVMEGTFTKPMPVPNRKPIAPTGKAFRISMSTVGRWNAQGTTEEYLFWDNATYMNNSGLVSSGDAGEQLASLSAPCRGLFCLMDRCLLSLSIIHAEGEIYAWR